jgi:hypothetical protein
VPRHIIDGAAAGAEAPAALLSSSSLLQEKGQEMTMKKQSSSHQIEDQHVVVDVGIAEVPITLDTSGSHVMQISEEHP